LCTYLSPAKGVCLNAPKLIAQVQLMLTTTGHVTGSVDNRARGKWIGNARAALFLMNGVSAQPLIEC